MRYFYASITITNLKRKLTISIDFVKWTVTGTLTQCHWKCKTVNSLENTVWQVDKVSFINTHDHRYLAINEKMDIYPNS